VPVAPGDESKHLDTHIGRIGHNVIDQPSASAIERREPRLSSRFASASILYFTLIPLKPLRTSLSMAKDAVEVHVCPRWWPSPSAVGYLAMLGDCGDIPAVRQLASPTSTYFDRRCSFVFGSKHLGMIGIELESRSATLFFSLGPKKPSTVE